MAADSTNPTEGAQAVSDAGDAQNKTDMNEVLKEIRENLLEARESAVKLLESENVSQETIESIEVRL